MKNIVLLGASGSIGQQTLDVIRNYKEKFKLKAFSVGRNTNDIISIIEEFKPEAVYLIDKHYALYLEEKYPKIMFYSGDELNSIFDSIDVDLCLNAIVGIAGLIPTVVAIEKGIDIALANKETLVAGGQLIMDLAHKNNVSIYPVDSEHSAIWQSNFCSDKSEIQTITLTASGGSFRDLSRAELANVTKDQALNHPDWSMGDKITIDSATMMNKGLEIIEAHYLFGIDYDKINVLLHKQSIVHSYVEFNDNSIIAQMGTADMRLPIQFALTFPNHLKLHGGERLDLKKIHSLTFEAVDFKRYPLVKLAYQVGKLKGNKPIILNAANEVAVDLFLNDKIKFLDIETIVIETVNRYKHQEVKTIEEVLKIDEIVRNYVKENYLNIIK